MVHHPTIQLSKEVPFRGKQPGAAAAAGTTAAGTTAAGTTAAGTTAAGTTAAARHCVIPGSSVRTLQYQGSRVRLYYHASNKGQTNPRLGKFSIVLL
jgi:hypothetical protein